MTRAPWASPPDSAFSGPALVWTRPVRRRLTTPGCITYLHLVLSYGEGSPGLVPAANCGFTINIAAKCLTQHIWLGFRYLPNTTCMATVSVLPRVVCAFALLRPTGRRTIDNRRANDRKRAGPASRGWIARRTVWKAPYVRKTPRSGMVVV